MPDDPNTSDREREAQEEEERYQEETFENVDLLKSDLGYQKIDQKYKSEVRKDRRRKKRNIIYYDSEASKTKKKQLSNTDLEDMVKETTVAPLEQQVVPKQLSDEKPNTEKKFPKKYDPKETKQRKYEKENSMKKITKKTEEIYENY